MLSVEIALPEVEELQRLIEQGLVDELRVMLQPILLGAGKSLFGALHQRVPVVLERTTVFSSGNVLLHYRPAAR